eukprot:scaffold3542_cov54-Phaeocystis_antarctica.AAC.6
MRWSRQPSLPLSAAHMRAVKPFCGGAAAAPHAVSGGCEGGAAGATGGEGRGRGAEGGGDGGGGAQRRQRGTARPRGQRGSGAQPPSLTPQPHTPRRHGAAGPRRTLLWAFTLAPLAMRCSRQSSLPS